MKPLTIFSLILICNLFLGFGEVTFAQQAVVSKEKQQTIQVIVQTSTWKTRGRLLYDVEGSIHKKLSLVGFRSVYDPQKPHHVQLVVQYEENRGAQYGIELWGTTINATFLLRGAGMANQQSWKIRETSTNRVSGPAPYLDALLKFETHPYYFFLGSMVKKMMKGMVSQSGALAQAVEEYVQVIYPTIDETPPQGGVCIEDHFMDNSQRVYQEVALQRALDELVNQDISDEALTPIAERLLDSTDPHSRVRAVQILGRTQNAAFQEKIKKLATDDPYPVVQETAQKFSSL